MNGRVRVDSHYVGQVGAVGRRPRHIAVQEEESSAPEARHRICVGSCQNDADLACLIVFASLHTQPPDSVYEGFLQRFPGNEFAISPITMRPLQQPPLVPLTTTYQTILPFFLLLA